MSDLIRREDAIDAIECVTWYHQNSNKDMVSGANSDEHQAWYKSQDIYEALENIPSAERPQGEWIVNMPNYESICSVCGAKETDFIYGTEMWYGLGESKFCPSCGARMKGADDE